MKQIQGLHMLISKESDESFTVKDILAFINSELIPMILEKKVPVKIEDFNVSVHDKAAYETFDSEYTEYIEDVYKCETSIKKSVNDPFYGSQSQFCFTEKLRKGIPTDSKLKDGCEHATVFLFVENDNAKLGTALRSIAEQVDAEYFKYQII